MQTRSPAEWRELDKQYVWHPFTQMRDWVHEDPIVMERGEGMYLYDVDGNRYIDGHSSLWVTVHGHCHPTIVAAVEAQLRRLDHATMLGLANPPAIELAKELVERAPDSLGKVFYSDAGSTAMEIALKMAFQYWRHRGETDRKLFITFEGAYHGDTIGSVSLGAIELFHAAFGPLLFETQRVPWPRPYRDTRFDGDPDQVRDACLDELDRALREHGDRVAAVSAEAMVQGADGMHVAPAGFLAGVQRLCRKHGVLLIVDEVATGFGRTGTMFACEHENIQPDLMAVAKGLTGGVLPLAATLASKDVYTAYLGQYEELKAFFHGHTYTGNPVACAAALANLALFDETDLLAQLPAKIETFRALLQARGWASWSASSWWPTGTPKQVGPWPTKSRNASPRRRLNAAR